MIFKKVLILFLFLIFTFSSYASSFDEQYNIASSSISVGGCTYWYNRCYLTFNSGAIYFHRDNIVTGGSSSGTYYFTGSAPTCGSYSGFSPPFPSCFVTCSDGSTAPTLSQCPVQCKLPQVLDNVTGACLIPVKRDCVIPENPMIADCKYPIDKGLGIDCSDGTTVYVPQICSPTAFDNTNPPAPGQQATCSDGTIISYPSNCLQHFTNIAKDQFGLKNIDIGSLVLSGKPVLRVAGFLVDGLPSIRAVLPIAEKINQIGISAFSKVDTSIPTITLGKAVQEYIKSSPSSPYVAGLITAVAAGTAATQLIVNQNTGQLTPQGSTVPLTSNQIGNLSLRSNSSVPIPLVDITPFLPLETIPWLSPALDAIEGDFKRIYDPAGSKEPLNFPETKNPLAVQPSPSDSISPLANLEPTSPSTYLKSPTTTSEPSPSVNPNPTGSPSPFVFQPVPSGSVTPSNPGISETPPLSPTLYPDTYKYFDFLPFTNPLLFNPSDFLPDLPSSSGCSYEIHKTLTLPLVGVQHVDIAPCLPLQPLRDVLAWAFGVLSIFICFNVIFRSSV